MKTPFRCDPYRFLCTASGTLALTMILTACGGGGGALPLAGEVVMAMAFCAFCFALLRPAIGRLIWANGVNRVAPSILKTWCGQGAVHFEHERPLIGVRQ